MLAALSMGCGSSASNGGSIMGTTPPPGPANAKEWTWEGGSSTRSSIPSSVYGTEGVAAAGNIPGGRAGAASWTDSSGNFWLFGGSRVDPRAQTAVVAQRARETGMFKGKIGAIPAEA